MSVLTYFSNSHLTLHTLLVVKMELRLLVEASDQSTVDTIVVEGRHWRLTDPIDISQDELIPPYVCVSYVWGPNRLHYSSIRVGEISDQTLPALATAIRSTSLRAFWTDFFCIPSSQPQRQSTLEGMGFIFSRAAHVIVILSQPSFNVLEQMTKRDTIDEDSLDVLEQDEWVRSVWTYQEVVNGRQLVFACGDHPGTVVEFAHCLNCVGYTLKLYKKKYNLDAFDIRQRYPGLDALENLIADYLTADYTYRSALQVMSNVDRRSYKTPENYFYSMIGAITHKPPSWKAADSFISLASTFMTVCESKNDYSFIYSSAPRAARPPWRPTPGFIPSILPWHLEGKAQRGRHDLQGFWLEDMVSLPLSTTMDDAGKHVISTWLSLPEAVQRSTSALAARCVRALRRIDFTGSDIYCVTHAGLFFPQEPIATGVEVTFLVATGVFWIMGAPGLACCQGSRETKDRPVTYIPGVFIGSVSRKEARAVLMADSTFAAVPMLIAGDVAS